MHFKPYTLLILLVVSLSACVTQKIETTVVKHKLPEFSWDKMPLYMHLRKATSFTNKEIDYICEVIKNS